MLRRALWAWAVVCLWPGAAGAVETMRIAIGARGAEVKLDAQSLAFGDDLEEGPFTPLRGKAVVRLERGRMSLNGAPLPLQAVRFRAGEALDAGAPGHEPIQVAELSVRGDVVVRAHRGVLQLINVVPLEEYLPGVLAQEMPRSFPEEALKAQAVAARTYALHRKLQALGQPYHLGSGVLGQVYGGLKPYDARARAAVEATRGLVLTHELAPLEAYFHASCGGRTESGLDALGRDLPYLEAVDCPCGDAPAVRWQTELGAQELEGALGGRARTLSVLSRTGTGRASRMALSGRAIDAVTFRERLGYSKVKSLRFEVERRGQAFVLTGRGHGHGAGLCQWGTKALAEQGWDFRRILEHYYPGAELQILY